MQSKFLPIARKMPDGKYRVERRYYCRSTYFTDWTFCERYYSVVSSADEAVAWFRPVVASFLGSNQENLSPLWVYCLPKSLWSPPI